MLSPRFVFIIGTSVVLAFRSMRRKGVSRAQLLRKLTWRTAVLMLLGFCFLNYSPRDGPRRWTHTQRGSWWDPSYESPHRHINRRHYCLVKLSVTFETFENTEQCWAALCWNIQKSPKVWAKLQEKHNLWGRKTHCQGLFRLGSATTREL